MLLGQAVGSAAVSCIRYNISPREAAEKYIGEIQQRLMEDDCTLPGFIRKRPELTMQAKLTVSNGADGEVLRSGPERGEGNFWTAVNGDWAEYDFNSRVRIREIRVIFDTDLERTGAVGRNLPAAYALNMPAKTVSDKIIAGFTIFADGKEIYRTDEQHLRCFRLPVNIQACKIRLQIDRTRGTNGNIFAFDIDGTR